MFAICLLLTFASVKLIARGGEGGIVGVGLFVLKLLPSHFLSIALYYPPANLDRL